jgi:hypothetical protein
MALYDVVPSANLADPIVIAAVARFRATSPKPEAFPAGATVDQSIAYALEQWTDRLAAALADRGNTPPVRWDASCDGAVRGLAARTVLDTRGRNRQKDAADGIDQVADDALAFIDRCKPSPNGQGKRELPRVVFANSEIRDRIRITSDQSADAWTRRRAGVNGAR